MNSAHVPKYSFRWAESVVESLWKKHPRATESVCEVFHVSRPELARFLAFGDPLWRFFRDLVKNTDILVQIHGKHYTDDKLLEQIRLKRAAPMHQLDPEGLDRVLKRVNSEEAEFKVPSGRSASGVRKVPSNPSVDALGRTWRQGVLCL